MWRKEELGRLRGATGFELLVKWGLIKAERSSSAVGASAAANAEAAEAREVESSGFSRNKDRRSKRRAKIMYSDSWPALTS